MNKQIKNISKAFLALSILAAMPALALAQNNNDPVISSISPNTIEENVSSTQITVNGSNFVSGSTVNLNGSALSTVYVSDTRLTATIEREDLASEDNSITVSNPDGKESASSPIAVSTAAPGLPNTGFAPGSGFGVNLFALAAALVASLVISFSAFKLGKSFSKK